MPIFAAVAMVVGLMAFMGAVWLLLYIADPEVWKRQK